MLKKSFIVIFALSLIFIAVGCKKTTDLSPYVSQVRSDILVGENDAYFVRCYLETRERPYKNDGKKEKTSFAVIVKLSPRSGETAVNNGVKVSFSTDRTYSALFAFHPEGDNYVALTYVDKLPERSLTVTIEDDERKDNVELKSVAKDAATATEALAFAQKEVSDMLKSEEFSGGEFEINVRLIEDGEKLYYFVGFITPTKTEALLLNGQANKVVARKTLDKRQ